MSMLSRGAALLMALVVLAAGCSAALAQTPPAGLKGSEKYFGAVPWELPDDAQKMVVASIVDGDTLKLTKPNDDWWESYRLIGIQAPEMDGPWTHEECYGPEAKRFLTTLLPKGSVVYVQKDISDKDRNGRFLRHVFLVDDKEGGAFLVSEILVLGGYAKARAYKPDDLYDDILADAQRSARQDDEGLWDACAA